MFYSQTYLGRNGPLSKVWCAAHLQHRLKKSDCTAVNIPKTVDHILYPDVPIALRMSGHLLLGVVRIYSKQVDYFFKDCNSILTRLNRIYTYEDINLPDNSIQAPFESVTLSVPNSFELDAMELDLNDNELAQDNHIKTREQITLDDQVPTGLGDFIAIRFDEDQFGPLVPDTDNPMQQNEHHSPDRSQIVPDGGSQPMEPFVLHSPVPEDNRSSGGPSGEPNDVIPSGSLGETPPEPETMRDAVNVSVLENLLPQEDNTMGITEEQVNDKETIFPTENPPTPGEPSPPVMQNSAPNSSGPSGEANEAFDAPVSFENNASPGLAIRSSPLDFVLEPSPQIAQPQNRRKRRKKQFFDESIVLTNGVMKKALEDASDISRKRKPLPSSDLGIWKLQKRSRKEQMFYEPLITGMSKDLGDMFQKGFKIQARLAPEADPAEPVSEPFPGNGDEQSPNGAPNDGDMELDGSGSSVNTVLVNDSMQVNDSMHSPSGTHEIEHMMDDRSSIRNNTFPDNEFFPSGSTSMMPSSSRLEDFTPFSGNMSPLTEQLDRTATTIGTTPDPSTGTYQSDVETPMTFSEDPFKLKDGRLSDIPELSPLEEDLGFLLNNDDSPTVSSSSGSRHSGLLSQKSSAMIKYLQRQTPAAQNSDEQLPYISLNKTLEGKTRKLAARMFFQTLVLKSFGVIDVQQDEAYGDISLRLQPQGLSKLNL